MVIREERIVDVFVKVIQSKEPAQWFGIRCCKPGLHAVLLGMFLLSDEESGSEVLEIELAIAVRGDDCQVAEGGGPVNG